MANPKDLAGLASRLTETQDRERYAALMCYLNALPPTDEFRRLAELMGLLSLLGQRLPEAIGCLLAELQSQAKAAAEYHSQVDARLAALPQEIAEGIRLDAVAKEMGEAFRQQIAATALESSATLLRNSSREITAMSGQIASSLKPVTQEYKSMAAIISSELIKLTAAADELQRQNADLFVRERSNALLWQAMLALVLFLTGGICGMTIGIRQISEELSSLYAQTQEKQTPNAPPVRSHSRTALKSEVTGARP